MNLGEIPIIVKKEEEEEEEEIVDAADVKLMLFPSQLHKISTLIAVLAHKRDLLERLEEQHRMGQKQLSNSLIWKMQLNYVFDKDHHTVQVKV